MCGRFTLRSPSGAIVRALSLTAVPDFAPRYNIAPTQIIAAVHAEKGGRELVSMRWGLIPSWSKEPGKVPLFNARAETVAEKPSFRSAFKCRRCIIPADGFFEWKQISPKQKQPLYFRPADDGIMAFAGLWETWNGGDQPVTSCTIITTTAGQDLEGTHDRMPVILTPDQYEAWLSPMTPMAEIEAMLRPLPGGSLYAVPVGPAVGNSRFDDPSCIQAVEVQQKTLGWGAPEGRD